MSRKSYYKRLVSVLFTIQAERIRWIAYARNFLSIHEDYMYNLPHRSIEGASNVGFDDPPVYRV